MFIPRTLATHVEQLAQWFPVISVTGPRQSGKSTLLQEMFPEFTYLNLEDPGLRELATEDAMGFLNDHGAPLIIDEVQYAPELFSAIQVVSDRSGKPGQYVLSGSQNFLLMEKITQSLAGRVGITHLLPLSYSEAIKDDSELSIEQFALQGGYPRIYNAGIPPKIYFDNYIQTYIDRDVRDLLKVRNHSAFRRFVSLCALQAGSLINYSDLANELDVSFQTVKNWTSILESSFITFPLSAFHTNTRKTLTKTPKLYFFDTGLLCHLLGIHTEQELKVSPHFGAVIENLIVAETYKAQLHRGEKPALHFYRDDSKAEVDLLDYTEPNQPKAVEIKKSQTFNSKFSRHLVPIAQELGIPPENRSVVYRGEHGATKKEFRLLRARDYLLSL